MNTAEIKLDLFRKIDNLKDSELERIYQVFLSLLTPSEKHIITSAEKNGIDKAMEYSKMRESYTHESVIKEAQERYPHLKFK
jgi:hypothetical protein